MLNARTPKDPLYRIGWGTKPWEYPDWLRAGRDASSGFHTFGNRFDDPNNEYRVLYAASQLVTCYVETLARFRPDYALLKELEAMEGDNDFHQIGLVPDEWFETRFIGTANVEGKYADVYSKEWIAHLRPKLSSACRELGLDDFDLSVLMQAKKRAITQMASSFVYDLGAYDGIYYESRHGRDMENWALFEYKAIINPLDEPRQVSKDDPQLRRALDLLQLHLVGEEARGGVFGWVYELFLGKKRAKD